MNGLIMISTIKNRISFVGCGDCLNKWTVQSCLSLCWNLLQWFIWCPDWEDSRWDYLSTILCGIALWCLQNTYGVVNSTFEEELIALCLTAQVLNGWNGWSAHWWPNLCPHSSEVKLSAMYTGDRLFVPSVCCTSIFSDMLGSNNPQDCSLIFAFKQQIGDVANCLLCTHILGIGELWSFSGYCTQFSFILLL